MKVCRNEAYFHLLAAEHRMMFFMQRLESSRRELEKVHSNYCRAVELLESGLDLPSQVDVEVGGEEEFDMGLTQPAQNRKLDLNEDQRPERDDGVSSPL